MLKPYISQYVKKEFSRWCFLLLLVWLYLNLLVSIELYGLTHLISWFVIGPSVVLLIIAWAIPKAISFYNNQICRRVYNSMRQKAEGAISGLKTLDDYEKKKIKTFLSQESTITKIQKAIESGYLGIVFMKKKQEKTRPLKQVDKMIQRQDQIWACQIDENSCMMKNNKDSSFTQYIDDQLPRKLIICFRDEQTPKVSQDVLGIRNGYHALGIDLHILCKGKDKGGIKVESRKYNKTAIGAFTVCEYTECVSSTKVGAHKCVALRERGANEHIRGILRRYRFQPSSGESLARMLSRSQTSDRYRIQRGHVQAMLRQILAQLRPWHEKNRAHMDLKLENITASRDFRSYNVIDYPASTVLEQVKHLHTTPWFGQMADIHGLLTQVVVHNKYLFQTGCEGGPVQRYCNISYQDRLDFEKIMANFEKRSERTIYERSPVVKLYFFAENQTTWNKYTRIGNDTVFQDVWAILYIAFIAFGELKSPIGKTGFSGEKDICQNQVFSIMKEMYTDYVQWHSNQEKQKMPDLTNYMNSKWPLSLVIEMLDQRIRKQLRYDPRNYYPKAFK